MKQKLLTLIVVSVFCFSFSFAAEDNRNSENSNDIENSQQINEDANNEAATPVYAEKSKKVSKGNAVKRFFKRTKERISEKYKEFRNLAPHRILALMIVGFLLMLPGMILSIIGVALIPAIVLVLVGGTLFIVGILAGK